MNEEDYMEQLKIAGDFHGEICGGVTVGTKMAMYGLELMGMELNQKHKNLYTYKLINFSTSSITPGNVLRHK